MSWPEIKKAINSRFKSMPLDEMFGLTLVSSETVTVSGSADNYTNFATVLDVQGMSGFVIFSPDSLGTKDFPDLNGAIPLYTNSSIFNNSNSLTKWLLPLDASKRYTFKQKCSRSGSPTNGYYYSSTTFTYALYSFGGGRFLNRILTRLETSLHPLRLGVR